MTVGLVYIFAFIFGSGPGKHNSYGISSLRKQLVRLSDWSELRSLYYYSKKLIVKSGFTEYIYDAWYRTVLKNVHCPFQLTMNLTYTTILDYT